MIKQIKWIILLVFSLLILASSVTFAYLYINKDKTDQKIIGTVDFDAQLFHQNGNNETPATLVNLNGKTKDDVYSLNVFQVDNLYHINKFRVNFSNSSNIETYLRVKFLSSLTLTYETSDSKLAEVETISEVVNFNIDKNLWKYNPADQYYYYIGKISPETSSLSFIIPGLNYPSKTYQYLVQFVLVFDAVQAHLGPINNINWPNTPPWGGDWQ